MSKRIMKTCIKCCDRFVANFEIDGKNVKEYDGYVPDFMPETHYGDYVELEIDMDTGQILNWNVPTDSDIEELKGE